MMVLKNKTAFVFMVVSLLAGFLLASCAPMNVPKGRSVDIPPASKAPKRKDALNEVRDAILTVPLGRDVLVPKMKITEALPMDQIGPYELRNETLASALQLILADFDIPLAFQTDEGLSREITVSNLKGSVDHVVEKLCGLADLYCSYEDGILEVKETETFLVSLPPLDDSAFSSISQGLEAVSGAETVIDDSTRTLIYTVTQRNAERARQYFKRMRASTALIVYETYIWEVQLNNENSAGIAWERAVDLGNFKTGIKLAGSLSNQVGTPITIGLPTKGDVNLGTDEVFRFISEQGAVKTISQPQLTVLSGSEASMRVAERINYVESLTRSTDADGDETVSTTTGTVDSGFDLTIQSSWDESTIYASIELQLDEFIRFDPFDAGSNDTLQLPRTSERELNTQVRARPGDSILIAGLVRERDEYDITGPGLDTPVLPTARSGIVANTELVILLRPRVVRYLSQEEIAKEQKEASENLFPPEKPLDLFPEEKIEDAGNESDHDENEEFENKADEGDKKPSSSDAQFEDMLNPSYGITPMIEGGGT